MSSRRHLNHFFNISRTSHLSRRNHCGETKLDMRRNLYSTARPRRFCSERLTSLVRTLQLTRIDEYSSLQKVASFATLVATYEKGNVLWLFCRIFCFLTCPIGFLLILEPFETENATVPNPIFHLTFGPSRLLSRTLTDAARYTDVSMPLLRLNLFLNVSAALSLRRGPSHPSTCIPRFSNSRRAYKKVMP
jgi:Helical and beta-bridge domain